MFPDWHHAVPESAYFKVPETLKTFRILDYHVRLEMFCIGWEADYGGCANKCVAIRLFVAADWQQL